MATNMNRMARTRSGSNALVTVAAAIGIIVLLVFFVSPRVFGRFDLTQNKVHTMTDASKEAVRSLDDLTVKVYISTPLPDSIKVGYGQTVSLRGVDRKLRDKLEEYQAYSNGQMKIDYVAEKTEDEAKKAKVQLFASDEAKVQKSGRLEFQEYALGAVFLYKNVKEVYPLAINPDTYELDITKILLRLKEKHEKSLLMKDMLSAGKEVFEAVRTCDTKIEAVSKPTDAGDNDSLKGLMEAAAKSKEDLRRFQESAEDIKKACEPIKAKMEAARPALSKHDNEYVRILLGGIEQYVQGYEQMMELLASPEPDKAAASLQVADALHQGFGEIDKDHDNLVNSPGQKQIGFVCGHGEFCPFPRYEPVIKTEMAALLGQQNPMVKQFVGQAAQVEQQINQINQGINQNLFKRRGFDIRKVDLNAEVPKDIEALVVFGPTKPMNDREKYELDQFLVRGRPVVVLLNQWDVSLYNVKPAEDLGGEDTYDYNAMVENSSNIGDLLEHYGVKPGKDLILEPKANEPVVVTVMTQQGRLRWQTQKAFPYPILPSFTDLDKDNVLVRGLDHLTLPYATTVSLTDAAKDKASVLIRTSAEAVIKPASELGTVPILPPEQLQMAQSTPSAGEGKPVGVMVAGDFESFYKGKEIPTLPAVEGKEPPKDDANRKTVESGKVRLLVLGSDLGIGGLNPEDVFAGFDMGQVSQGGIDFLKDLRRYYATFQNWQIRISQISESVQANLKFLFNVMDWAIQNDALVEIRGKEYTPRPLDRIEDGTKRTIKYANILGVPALFIAFGIVRWALRRRRKLTL